MLSDQFKPKSYFKLIKNYIFSEREQFPLKFAVSDVRNPNPKISRFYELYRQPPEIINFKGFEDGLMEFPLPHLKADSWAYAINRHLW